MRLFLLASLLASPCLALVPGVLPRPPIRSLQLIRSRSSSMATMLAKEDGEGKDSGSSEFSTDWDNAWQEEVEKRSQGTQSWRPEGREPISPEALREARMNRMRDETMAGVQKAAGGWQLWAGLIAFVAVLTAVAGHDWGGGAGQVVV